MPVLAGDMADLADMAADMAIMADTESMADMAMAAGEGWATRHPKSLRVRFLSRPFRVGKSHLIKTPKRWRGGLQREIEIDG